MSAFVYRGPLAPDSRLFRGRKVELAQLTRLCQGEVQAYAIVYGGRQTGKTSLMLRLAADLPESIKTCRVDFQGLPGALSPQVYNYLAQRITHSLTGNSQKNEVNDAPSLIDFFCQVLGQPGIGRVVLLLEELGALPPSAQNDLANVLRSIFSNRFDPSYRPLARLMVVFAGNVELYDLVAKQVSPLYNICEPLYLPDLGKDDAVSLVAEVLAEQGALRADADLLGQAIYDHVGGYPYLTQRLGGFLEDALAASKVLSPAYVDYAAERLLGDDPLLRHLRGALDTQNLMVASKSLLDGRLRFSRLDEEMARLELLGLAAESDGYWKTRNRLLERALRKWTGPADPDHPSPNVGPDAEIASLKRQLAQLRANLLKLQEQRAEFIDPRSAPPDLEEAKKRTSEEIAEIEARLAKLG